MSKLLKKIPLLQFLTSSCKTATYATKSGTSAAGSGSSKPTCKPKKQIKKKKKSEKDEAPPPSKALMYRNICLFGVFPSLVVFAIYVFKSKIEEERPKFVRYEYMRLRRKRFPWGDGNKSFFHNPDLNALPDGYEDEIERREQEKMLEESKKKKRWN